MIERHRAEARVLGQRWRARLPSDQSPPSRKTNDTSGWVFLREGSGVRKATLFCGEWSPLTGTSLLARKR